MTDLWQMDVRVRALGRHGDLPSEQEHPQPFEIDVTLWADLTRSTRSDLLADTIDYVRVVEAVRGIVEGSSVQLIETLSSRIADALLGLGAARVRVRVGKPAVALMLGAQSISVTLERSDT